MPREIGRRTVVKGIAAGAGATLAMPFICGKARSERSRS